MFETWRCERCGPLMDFRAQFGSLSVRCSRCEGEMVPLGDHDFRRPIETPPDFLLAGVGPTEIDAHDRIDALARLFENLNRRIGPLEADALQLLEARIATMTLDELDALNERLEQIGVRMVERAGELRRKLREQQ